MSEILWMPNDRLSTEERAWSATHPDPTIVWYGRCRSGKRWFWLATTFHRDGSSGFADTEQEAYAEVRAAVERIADGKPAKAILAHGWASSRLNEINKAKRAAKPAPNTKGSNAVEYLYAYTDGGDMGDGSPIRYRITKKTAKRIFFLQDFEFLDMSGNPESPDQITVDRGASSVDRRQLEQDGEIWCRPMRKRLYLTFEGCVAWRSKYKTAQIPEADLHELKMAMAAAHPDRGGSSAAFIAARARYMAAKAATGSPN
jgi:hypothetical protein